MDVLWKRQGDMGWKGVGVNSIAKCQLPRGTDRGRRDRERENMESKGERGKGDEAG